MMPDPRNTLYPDWQGPTYPSWIGHGPKPVQNLFASAYGILGDQIVQMQADGLDHMIPPVLAERMKPQDARKAIGKAIWKDLYKSTLKTNIARARLRLMVRMPWQDIMQIRPCHLHSTFSKAKAAGFRNVPNSVWFAATKAPRGDFQSVRHMHIDANRMGIQINPDWSITRLKKEHDSAARAIKLQGVSTAKWATDMTCWIDGYCFRRLTSAAAIVEEGIIQRHCVGSYARVASAGAVLIFSIEGKERATVMFKRRGLGDISIDQIYAACNKRASFKCIAAANKLSAFINKHGTIARLPTRLATQKA